MCAIRLPGPAVAICLMFIQAPSVSAQEAAPVEDALLDSLVGTWSGSGEVAGMRISDAYTWEWALDHQFLFGVHQGTLHHEAGDETVNVHFYLHPNGDGTYTGVAVTSEGAIRNLTAHLSEEGALVNDETNAEGNTRRMVVATTSDTLTISFLMSDGSGGWSEAGSVTLTRQ